MTTIRDFTPVRRDRSSVLIGLAGGSSSGKTLSGLLLADGISGDTPFAMLDTEGRRGQHYGDIFANRFEHRDLEPPYHPDRVWKAVEALRDRGFGTIVIDSMSHEWDGPGGIREMADAEAARMKKDNPAKWAKPKDAHNRMMQKLLTSGINLIFCLRAKDKIDMSERDAKGKVIVRQLGWRPIQEKQFIYEMTIAFTLTEERQGRIDLRLPHKIYEGHRPIFPDGEILTRAMGEELGRWARGESIQNPHEELWAHATVEAETGTGALRTFWTGCTKAERRALRPINERLKVTADEADRILGIEPDGETEEAK